MTSKLTIFVNFFRQRSLLIFGILCFFPPVIIATNYTLNHFFIRGCYTYDSGLLGYLQAHSLDWPMPDLPFLEYRSFFATHIIFIFYPLSYFRDFLEKMGLSIHNSVYLSVSIGVWLGITACATYSLFVSGKNIAGGKQRPPIWFCFIAFIFAVGAGLNGISISSLGLPHFELLIPALLITFFAFYLNGYKKTACFFIFLGLMTREDVGIHYFLFLFLLTLYLFNSKKVENGEEHASFIGTVACSCLLISVSMFIFQKMFYSGYSVAHNVYFGEEPFAHLIKETVKERLKIVAENRHYIFDPMIAITIWALIRRDFMLSIGVLAVIPWIVFSLMAIGPNPSHLTSYYVFPIVITFVWPIISYRLGILYGVRKQEAIFSRLIFPGFVIFLSIFGLRTMGYLHDNEPWGWMGFSWWGKVSTNLKSVDRFFIDNEASITFAADDAVTCMRNEKRYLKPWRWASDLNETSVKDIDTIIYLPNSRLQYGVIGPILSMANFPYYCSIDGSNFMVSTRHNKLKGCSPQPGALPKDPLPEIK